MKRISACLAAAAFACLVCGCATDTREIRRGMDRAEVYRILGTPDSESENVSEWVDRNRSSWSFDKGNFTVKFVDDKVSVFMWKMIYIQRHDQGLVPVSISAL